MHDSVASPPSPAAPGAVPKTTEKVIDPVCGMTVDPAKAAASSTYRSTTYSFCHPGCKTKFDADPERYLAPAAAVQVQDHYDQHGHAIHDHPTPAAVPAGTKWICPMDPEVASDKPGACPKCGMALEPEMPVAPACKVEWTCPMHPEIVRDAPGSCPICGMALEPRTVTAEEPENPELVDMTRRFWVSAVLTVPLVALAMGGALAGTALGHRRAGRNWLRAGARDAGGAVGRLAVLRARLGSRSSTAASTCSR